MIANRYKIIKRVGQGGMADVYLAQDTILQREVAIKILRGELSSDPVSLLRFKREAEAIGQLSHPNIVKIYDVGEEDGKQFIVMEFVEGKTLKQLIANRGALYKEEAVSIMKQLVSAVTAANEKGIIHRDIKPQNILVKDDGTVKITDFGIAATQDAVQLTQQDSIMGSVHYLAPELARGEMANAQSDIYSLGIVFYELLTGDVPYRGKTAVEIAMMHLRDDIPSVRDFNPSLPQSIENIIIKATTKNLNHRYQTAKEMYLDLLTALEPKREHEPKLVIKNTEDDGKTIAIPKLQDIKQEKKKKRLKIFLGGGIALVAIIGIFFLVKLMGDNSGSRLVTIPEVANLTIAEATERLEAEGLVVALERNEVITEDKEKNIVVGTTPEASTQVEKGQKVILTISKGKMITIEDYTGKTLDEVRSIFQGTKISVVVQTEINMLHKENTVLRQSGLKVGDKVDPTVSQQMVVVVAKPAGIMLLQAWIGQDVSMVEQSLMDSGIKVRLTPLDASNLKPEEITAIKVNTVVRMTPEAGTYFEQKEDNFVELFYYSQVPTPSTPEPEETTPPDTENNDG